MRYIIILLFIIISHWAQAQWHFVTKDLEIYSWVDEQWEMKDREKNYVVKFEFDKDFSKLLLTRKNIDYSYKILSSEYERKLERYFLEVIDVDGFFYFLIIDFKDQNIRFLSEDGTFCLLHNIKKAKKTKQL